MLSFRHNSSGVALDDFVMALLAVSKLVNNGVATTMHGFSTWNGCLCLCLLASWR